LTGLEALPLGLIIGLVFVLAGLVFKISAAPFHMWTPDVYQGAPTSTTAFFAIAPKVAAMGLLIRLLMEPFGALSEQWVQILYFVSVLSMVVGSFAAIVQEDIKRLLAYSSIGNMGYALIGLVAGGPQGVSAVVLYLLIYMISTAGVFAVVLSMRRQGLSATKISDLSGLSKTAPGLAYAMFILMFSISGIPPLAGFFGKLLIFNAAVAEGYYVLATFGLLTSVVAAFYYLRIVKVMFFDDVQDPLDAEVPFARRFILAVVLCFVIGFVFKPMPFIHMADNAVSPFFAGQVVVTEQAE